MSTSHPDPRSMLEPEQSRDETRSMFGWLARLFSGRPRSHDACTELNELEAYLNHIKWRQQLIATGQPARAIVRELSDTGTLINFNRIITLQLDVHADGHPAWRVAVTTPLSKLALPSVNDVIEVRYDPMNPEAVALL